MPLRGPQTRHAQLVSTGLGKHFQSPLRPRDKSKTQKLIKMAGQSAHRRRLAARLEKLQAPCWQGENHDDVHIPSGIDFTYQDVPINDLQPEMDIGAAQPDHFPIILSVPSIQISLQTAYIRTRSVSFRH